MAQILKPDYTYLWGQGGAVLTPSDSKIQQGWTAEIPINQWENWAQLRQDQGIAYLFQRGIAEWDSTTEYFASKSVTLYDGQLYIALTNNTNSQPDTATSDWAPVTGGDPLASLSGMVVAFATATVPEGFLKANGAAVSRTTYARLFSRIGTTFGAGNGTTTFNLPDARSEFIRGWADDRTDLDAGRAFGSIQNFLVESHTHTGSTEDGGFHNHTSGTTSGGEHTHSGTAQSAGNHRHIIQYHNRSPSPDTANAVRFTTPTGGDVWSNDTGTYFTANNFEGIEPSGDHTHSISIDSGGTHSHDITVDSGGTHNHGFTTGSTGGSETRPHNLALLYCIKY